MNEARAYLAKSQKIIVKIGSSLLIDASTGMLRQDWLRSLADDINALISDGKSVILVSSGAIALGRTRLGLRGKSLSLAEKQACAAAGQAALTQGYEDVLAPLGHHTAQALLTLMDTEDRQKWLNARNALTTLLSLSVVPIINENDTVATDEIRYGDNDRLAARTAQMIGADLLILLSDIDGLYTADPRTNTDAEFIDLIPAITDEIITMGGGANAAAGLGSGGMATKIRAAQIAAQAGCHTIITKGEAPHPLSRLARGGRASLFLAQLDPISARKQWISGALKPRGVVEIDAGAQRALFAGRSLLPAGVTDIKGDFAVGDAVTISHDDRSIAVGLAAYSAQDARRIAGQNSGEIEPLLGYYAGDNLVHRDNLVLLKTLDESAHVRPA